MSVSLGYPRQANFLYQELGYQLYGFHDGLLLLARWDRSHPSFGCVIGTQAEVAKRLGIQQSTVSRLLKRLEKKKYVIRHKQYIILKYFSLFDYNITRKIQNRDYANINELYADVYKLNAKLQEEYAIKQQHRAQKDSKELYSSSKGNTGFFGDAPGTNGNGEEDYNWAELGEDLEIDKEEVDVVVRDEKMKEDSEI